MRDDGYELKGHCPICRQRIVKRQLTTMKIEPRPLPEADASDDVVDDDVDDDAKAQTEEAQAAAAVSSSKLDALVAVLRSEEAAHPKSVVFTHFGA